MTAQRLPVSSSSSFKCEMRPLWTAVQSTEATQLNKQNANLLTYELANVATLYCNFGLSMHSLRLIYLKYLNGFMLIDDFIERWLGSGGSEMATAQSFAIELDLLP